MTETIKVNTKRLETILDENAIRNINYLSIDVEGAEYEVLRKMIKEDSLSYINDLYVEFHSHKDENAISENGENKETTFKLIEEIKQLGIKFTHWV